MPPLTVFGVSRQGGLPYLTGYLSTNAEKPLAGFPENPRVSLSLITGKKTRSEGNIRNAFKQKTSETPTFT